MSLFDEKNISPMLLYETKPFNDKNYIYELKLDGSRCIVYLDKNETILKNKRQKILNVAFPELNFIHKQASKRCILDGEIICMKNGKPDFYTLQARSLLVDPVKIHYQSMKNPAQFVAYDILFVGNEDITMQPLLKRKEILDQVISENNVISKSRFIEEMGIEFFNLAKKEDLEGIVAKEKYSLYTVGKRSKVWLKIKVMQEDDALICGYLMDEEGKIKDLILGIKNENDELEYYAKIYMGLSKHDEQTILNFAEKYPSKPLFENIDDPNIVWIKPKLIGVVKYMMKTKSGGLRQPVFKGIKYD